MGAFWFLKLEIQSLNSVLASSEADSYWAGCSPAPAQKKVSFPKDSNYNTSSNNYNNSNNHICHYVFIIYQALFQGLPIFLLFKQQLFLDFLLSAKVCASHLPPRGNS